MGAAQSSVDGEDHLSIKTLKEIRFHLQDVEHVAKCQDITPGTSLNYYLRNILNMTGTKGMCFEGGCGACVVVLQNKDPVTQKNVFLAVNSCLIPLLSCNGWRIYTIEGIGNAVEGYHPIQEVLAQFNGTQCGFCSPGMVMNMYALYESGKLTMEEVENSFSGNLCRCTGYRPILAAFKSLCKDASSDILGQVPDVEDFVYCYKEECAKKCTPECTPMPKEPFYLNFASSKWIKVHTLRDLLKTLSLNHRSTYRLVAGNTAQGVYPSYKEEVDLYIDITEIPELTQHKLQGDSCILGANITLTDTIEFFQQVAKDNPKFSYLKLLADHIDLVANVPVRNRATIAGNLMIKYDHHEFPSDIFVILETSAAVLTVVNLSGHETRLSPLEFMNSDIRRQRGVLKTITLKAYPDSTKYISYKIMSRAQNVHAIVNAGFLLQFNGNNIENATIVYGNINSSFVHARATEIFLSGKNLFDNSVLKQAYSTLGQELKTDVIPPDPSPEMRKKLAISLFYKGVLSIAPDNKISPRNKSGSELLKRPLSNGAQDYETNKSLYPVNQPISKIEALAQTAGEAEYVVDFPDLPFQLYGALVLAKVPPNSIIKQINPSRALKCEDIVAFYSKDDIPGDNIFTPKSFLNQSEEELFCDGRVKFYEQPIGILVGKTQRAVNDAVDFVTVTYDPPNVEPLITIRQVMKEGRTDKINNYKTIQATRRGNDIKQVIKGTFDIYHQYHFHMETQCCQVVPTENGLNVFIGSHWMDSVQISISRVLKIPQHKINVTVRRAGGSFGAKITRGNLLACSAALVAWKLKKPVKIWLPLMTNMAAIGKRFPLSSDYEVGVDDKGVIQYMDCDLYTNVGYQFNEDVSLWLEPSFTTTYTSDTFTVKLNRVQTDTHCNTFMRGPGSVEGLAAIESIVEHIAVATNLDPLDVRLANLSNAVPIAKYINDMKSWADIDKRRSEIEAFNQANRWKKRGVAVVPMNFDIFVVGPYLATVSIFNSDGTVQVSHGGIEIGQGINTKAAQVCAYELGIPLESVTILPSNSFVAPNNIATGTTVTSDGVCYAIIQACKELLARIAPFRAQGDTWAQTIQKCQQNFVQLSASGFYSPNSEGVKNYSVYGICASEVEVDILTGQHIVTRVDIIEDTGISLSPNIDIGQIEGGYVQGLGYYTLEKIIFNYEGKILTNNTWTYHIPGAKDIPVNFNVKIPNNNPNPVGVLNSKGTGEPPFCFSISVAFALRNALASARTEASPSSTKWFPIDGATDVESVLLHTLSDPSQYVL